GSRRLGPDPRAGFPEHDRGAARHAFAGLHRIAHQPGPGEERVQFPPRLARIHQRIDRETTKMGRLSGKVAIITGGGQGVAQGITPVFARDGARVRIPGRTPDQLEAAVTELRAAGGDAAWIAGTAGVRADAEAAVARAVELFGGLDILVNNAQP